MVIVVKVVGIDKIKIFSNFIFQKSAVIFTGYQHLRRQFFIFACACAIISMDLPCGKLSIAGLRIFAQEARGL
jgi:hypothetical protein